MVVYGKIQVVFIDKHTECYDAGPYELGRVEGFFYITTKRTMVLRVINEKEVRGLICSDPQDATLAEVLN